MVYPVGYREARSVLAATFAFYTALGCGERSTQPPTGGEPTDQTGIVSCEADSRLDAFGASKAGKSGAFKITLQKGEPSPPARGTNRWTLEIADASGAKVSGAKLEVTLFMPDHGHGSSIRPQVAGGEPGTYTVDSLYFFMPGVWEVTVDVDANGVTDSVKLTFCVPG